MQLVELIHPLGVVLVPHQVPDGRHLSLAGMEPQNWEKPGEVLLLTVV